MERVEAVRSIGGREFRNLGKRLKLKFLAELEEDLVWHSLWKVDDLVGDEVKETKFSILKLVVGLNKELMKNRMSFSWKDVERGESTFVVAGIVIGYQFCCSTLG